MSNEKELRDALETLKGVQAWFKATKGHWTYPMSAFGWEATENLVDVKLEALTKENEGTEPKPPETLEEFEKRLWNDPVAHAYYNFGRAVEKDSRLTDEQKKARTMEQLYSAVKLGILVPPASPKLTALETAGPTETQEGKG